jgi:hypothetical protein
MSRTDRREGSLNRTVLAAGLVGLLCAPLEAQLPADLVGASASYPTGGFPRAVAIADFNGDGRNDVAASINPYFSANDNSVLVYVQSSNGTLAAPYRRTTCVYPQSLAVGDVSGDGRVDLVVGCSGYGSPALVIHRQLSDGTFDSGETRPLPYPPTVAVADLSSDGRLDIAFVTAAGVTLIKQAANGTLMSDQSIAFGTTATGSIRIADFTNDGSPDLTVLIPSAQRLAVFPQANGSLGPEQSFSLVGGRTGYSTAIYDGVIDDFTGDGLADVAVTWGGNLPSSGLTIYPRSGAGIGTPLTRSSLDIPQAVEMADMDGNGWSDIVTLHGGTVNAGFYFRAADGSVGAEKLLTIPDSSNFPVQSLAIADVTGDGLPDLVMANQSNTALVVMPHKPDPPPLVTLTEPKGIGALTPGTSVAVNWTATDNGAIQRFDLEFSADGSSFSSIAECANLAASETTCAWTVPNIATATARVRVKATDTAGSVGFGTSGALLIGIGISVADTNVTEGQEGFAVVSLTSPASSAVTISYQHQSGTATPGDYVLVPGSITIPPGATTGQIPLRAIDDSVEEPSESFSISVAASAGVSVTRGTAIVEIVDDDPPTVSLVPPFERGVNEGMTAPIQVRLSYSHNAPVTVGYEAVPGTAGRDDFSAGSSAVVFMPGETLKTIGVATSPDSVDEEAEVFFVNLTTVSAGSIGVSQAVVTILPVGYSLPSLSVASLSLQESSSSEVRGQLQAVLSRPSEKLVTVAFATEPVTASREGDFVPMSGSLAFLPGVSSVPIPITIKADAVTEPDETFKVNLAGPVNAALPSPHAIVTIVDASPPRITIDDVVVTEGNAGATAALFTVRLSTTSLQTVSVAYTTADGSATTSASDYVAASGTLTFSPGAATQTISVSVTGDTQFESNETFAVNLSGAVNATISDTQAAGTITNDDVAVVPTLTAADFTVTEGSGGRKDAILIVSLASPNGSTVTVDYATSAGSATSGVDFQATTGSLSFPAGTTTRSITVSIEADALDEDDERFYIALSNATNATVTTTQATATIEDDDPSPSIAIDDVTLSEGTGGAKDAAFTLTLSAPSGRSVSVLASTADDTAVAGSDYNVIGPTVITIAAGETRKTLTVPILSDSSYENTEKFVVNLTAPVNATIADAQGVATIRDDDPSIPVVSISSPAASTTVSGLVAITATATDALSVTAVDFYVDDALQGTDTTAPYSLLWDSRMFKDGARSLLVKATNTAGSVGVGAAVPVIITNTTTLPALSVADAAVVEGHSGHSLLAFTLSLDAASAQDVSVSYSTGAGTATAGLDYTPVQKSVMTIPAGATTKKILVPVTADLTAEPDETLYVYLTTPSNAILGTPRAVGTIVNDDPAKTATTVAQYRLYHDRTNAHLYTTDLNEYNVLGTQGWIQEGIAYRLLTNGVYEGIHATIPFFRVYHPGTQQHLWTTDPNEAAALSQTPQWFYEGTIGYLLPSPAAGTVPLYRLSLANPALHLWTTDKNEYETLAAAGWMKEGVVGYVVP